MSVKSVFVCELKCVCVCVCVCVRGLQVGLGVPAAFCTPAYFIMCLQNVMETHYE